MPKLKAPEFSDDQLVMLARSSLGGKKTKFLKGACSEELKELMERKLQLIRAETGRTVTESEYVERVVAISLLGYEHVASVEQEQLKSLAGFWSHLGQRIGVL
ncbi:hypothetical protein D9M73_114160 [compost metagenome]